jgi:hypothetical protein
LNSSTRRFLSALAFSCTSAVLGAAEPPPARTPEQLRLVELEGNLAKLPQVYLALDPAAQRLDVRLRGIVLERIELVAVTTLRFRPLFGEDQAPPLLAPAVWSVSEGPGDTDRETIAPVTLKPYPKEGEEEEAPAEPGATPTPAAKKPGDDDKPSTYRVRLDNEWQLYVINEVPQLDGWRRYQDAVMDGWQRIRGEEPAHPPLLTLVMSADDAKRLHHLFRAKMPILVGDGIAAIR